MNEIFFLLSFLLFNSFCSYFSPLSDGITLVGRFDTSKTGEARFDWSASTILFQYKSKDGSVSVKMDGNSNPNYFNFFLDGELFEILQICNKTQVNLQSSPNEWHSVEITKRTEAEIGVCSFLGVETDDVQEYSPHSRKFLWLGDSLTTGYGDEGTIPNCPETPSVENNYVSFNGIVSRHFDAYYHCIAWEGRGLVRNYGDLSHTSAKPLPYYLDWVCGSDDTCGTFDFSLYQDLDAIFVYLGANDYTTINGSKEWQPTNEQYMEGYELLIPRLMDYFPNTKYYFFICGDTLPGKEHPWCDLVQEEAKLWSQRGIKATFINDSNDHTGVVYPEDLGCEGHPNIKGHAKMAANMISVVEKETNWN